jgi:hypothetical protein
MNSRVKFSLIFVINICEMRIIEIKEEENVIINKFKVYYYY